MTSWNDFSESQKTVLKVGAVIQIGLLLAAGAIVLITI